MKKIIICHNMKVLCYSNGKVFQKDIPDVHDVGSIICIENKYGSCIATLDGEKGYLDISTMKMTRPIPDCFVEVQNVTADMVSISWKNKFLRANHLGLIDCVVEEASLWEYFRLLSEE